MSIQFENATQLAKFCAKLFTSTRYFASCKIDAFSINIRPHFSQVQLEQTYMSVDDVKRILDENKIKYRHVNEF